MGDDYKYIFTPILMKISIFIKYEIVFIHKKTDVI